MNKPNYETLEKYGLIYYGGKPMEPKFVGTSQVWAWQSATEDQLEEVYPTYAIYNAGTNTVIVLAKYKGKDWEKIHFDNIEGLYSIVWKMLLQMPDYEEPKGMGFLHWSPETIVFTTAKDVTKLTME